MWYGIGIAMSKTFSLFLVFRRHYHTKSEVAVQRSPRKKYSENMQHIYRERLCRSAISIKLLCNFIEIALRHGCSLVNLLHIFRTLFPRNTCGRLLLELFLEYFLEHFRCHISWTNISYHWVK